MANRKSSFSFRSLFSSTSRPSPTPQSKTDDQSPSTKPRSSPSKLQSQSSPRTRPVPSTSSQAPKKASTRGVESPISTARASKSKLGAKSDGAKSFNDGQTKATTSSMLDSKPTSSSTSRPTKKASTHEIEAPLSTAQASKPRAEVKLNNAKSFDDMQMMASTSSKTDNKKPKPSSPSPSQAPIKGSTQEIEAPILTAQTSRPKEEIKSDDAKSSNDAQIIASTTSKSDSKPAPSSPSQAPSKASTQELEVPIPTAQDSQPKAEIKSDDAKSSNDVQLLASTTSKSDSKPTPSSPSQAPSKASTQELEAPMPTAQDSQPKAEIKSDDAKSPNDAQILASPTSKSDSKPTPSSPSQVTNKASTQELEDPMPTAQDSQPQAEIKSDDAKSSNNVQILASTTSKSDSKPLTSSPSQAPNKASTRELEAPMPIAQASMPKAEVKSGGAQSVSDTQMKVPALSELNTKPTLPPNEQEEEIKEVKEVVNESNNNPKPESNKEVDKLPVPSPNPCPGADINVPKPNKAQMLQQETNAILANITQPKKQSRIGGTREKSVLPSGRQHVPLQKDIKNDVSAFVNRMSVEGLKSSIQDGPVSVITLAGENRGASMRMGGSNSSNGEKPVYIHRGYKNNTDQSVEATSDGDGRTERMNSEDQPEAYVNNNAQGINNSIVSNSSITERNPGVHMVVTHGLEEAIHSETIPTAQKTEFNMARGERLTNESTVRRRCLRGLLLESSDSNEENPEKPRRHGCRVNCQKQSDKEDN